MEKNIAPYTFWPGTLPNGLGYLATEVSNHIQTDLGLVIPALLGICSACVHDKVNVKIEDPTTGSFFTESLSLNIIGIADSSERKSPVMKVLKKAPEDFMRDFNLEKEEERMKASSAKKNYEWELKNLRKKLIRLLSGSPQRKHLEEEILALEKKLAVPIPSIKRIFLQDTTAIAAAEFMREQEGHSLFIMDAEGGSFDAIRADHRLMELLLSGYSNEAISFERASKPSVEIASPHAGICILTQIVKLQKLAEKTNTWSEGFIPRSLVFFAQPKVGHREHALGPNIDAQLVKWWEQRVRDWLSLPYKEGNEPYTLSFDTEAAHYWCNTSMQFEQRMKCGEFPKEMGAWIGKVMGNMARLAAIFHCFESPNPLNEQIPIQRIWEAHALIEALIPHTYVVHGIYFHQDNPVQLAVAKIVNYLYMEHSSIEYFKVRDMYRELGLKAEPVKRACDVLCSQGVLRLRYDFHSGPKKPGRHGTPIYDVDYSRLYTLYPFMLKF